MRMSDVLSALTPLYISGMSQLYPKIKASRMKRTLLFVRDAFFITLFKTLFSIYKIHEFFTSRGSVESACKV